jgi:hypothetical protein
MNIWHYSESGVQVRHLFLSLDPISQKVLIHSCLGRLEMDFASLKYKLHLQGLDFASSPRFSQRD